jgi:hypothetical protein
MSIVQPETTKIEERAFDFQQASLEIGIPLFSMHMGYGAITQIFPPQEILPNHLLINKLEQPFTK